MSHATILCSPGVTPLDRRLARLAASLGIECHLETVAGETESALLTRDHHCVMASADTLGSLLDGAGPRGALVTRLLERTRYLLVYGCRPSASSDAAVRHLSGGAIRAVIPAAGSQYVVASDHRPLTREFTGLAFGPTQPAIDSVLSGDTASPELRPVVSIAGVPSFASLTRGSCTVFLLACADVADLDTRITGELRVVDWFSRVIPLVMFLRHAFGRAIWHNPRPTASFIIDDPLLKENYGFLNYRHLLGAMRDLPFSATIAFIPLNHRRSQASVVELFRRHPDRLSLCIHGCDHTGGEFATTDLSALNAMSRLAAGRMRAHDAATALAHGKIMVFPQGRFSAASLRALRANGYAAAVNTSPLPDGAPPDDHLTLGEWLDVAVTRYHGFPLFVRRYPGDLVDFAFDVFIGKPLLVVEHHTGFKHGYQRVADFIAALNSLTPDLRWGSLGDTLGHATLQRHLPDGSIGIRVWSNRSVLRNDEDRPKTYSLVKREAAGATVHSVTVDGRPVDHVVDAGLLRASVPVEPLSSRVVDVAYADHLPSGQTATGFRRALAIHARRRLSELRDELLSRQHRFRTLVGFGG